MAWRSGGSLARSISAATRAPRPTIRPPPALPRPPSASRRLPSFAPSRNLGELGCVQSLLPLHSMVAKTHLTSHLNANLRAFCELSHGTFRHTCQDR